MTDSEKMDLLLETIQTMDKRFEKLESDVAGMKDDIKELRTDVTGIKLDIENEIKPNIQLLAENYVPAAKRYEAESDKIENLESDVDILKKVVSEHSEKLQQLA